MRLCSQSIQHETTMFTRPVVSSLTITAFGSLVPGPHVTSFTTPFPSAWVSSAVDEPGPNLSRHPQKA